MMNTEAIPEAITLVAIGARQTVDGLRQLSLCRLAAGRYLDSSEHYRALSMLDRASARLAKAEDALETAGICQEWCIVAEGFVLAELRKARKAVRRAERIILR